MFQLVQKRSFLKEARGLSSKDWSAFVFMRTIKLPSSKGIHSQEATYVYIFPIFQLLSLSHHEIVLQPTFF